MSCRKQELFRAYLKLLELENQCASATLPEYKEGDLTPRQVYYLRIIDGYDALTCSDLAQYTDNSKPTVTEMVNKFISWDCVVKQRSDTDRRVCYIRLTPKGKRIARAEEMQYLRLVEHIENSLTEEEVKQLIELLNKLSIYTEVEK